MHTAKMHTFTEYKTSKPFQIRNTVIEFQYRLSINRKVRRLLNVFYIYILLREM